MIFGVAFWTVCAEVAKPLIELFVVQGIICMIIVVVVFSGALEGCILVDFDNAAFC